MEVWKDLPTSNWSGTSASLEEEACTSPHSGISLTNYSLDIEQGFTLLVKLRLMIGVYSVE